jgi:cytoskeletal protein CcmA (bactofilin family)
MKRLPRRILSIAALLIVAAAVIATNARRESPIGVHSLTTLVSAAAQLGVTPALAQESLEFKTVPAESLDAQRSEDDVRRSSRVITGHTLRIKSGDIMRVGSDVTIAEDQEVQGDVLAIRGDVIVDGHVEGNVVSMGGDIRLSETARVDGDVVCMGGKLHEEPGAVVGGQRVTALDPDSRSKYRSRTIHIDPEWNDRGAAGKLVFYLVLLGLVWGLCMIAPGSTGAALASLKARPAASLGLGFLVWLLAVPSLIALCLVVAILCITIIGIPLALIALLGYFVFFALLILWGYAVGAAALGERLLERRGETSPSLGRAGIAGVIAIAAVSILSSVLKWLDFIPLMGVLSALTTAVVVLGTIVLTSMGAGAWMHTEFTSGTLGRWWKGSSNRMRRNPPPPPPDAPPSGGTPPPPPPPPAAPADPARYAPPATQSPGFGQSATTPPPEGGSGEGPATPV